MRAELLVPSSVMLAVLVTQLAGVASVPACSNAKPAVSADGQETITSAPERRTESAGGASTVSTTSSAALPQDGFDLRVRRVGGQIWFTYTNVVLVASR